MSWLHFDLRFCFAFNINCVCMGEGVTLVDDAGGAPESSVHQGQKSRRGCQTAVPGSCKLLKVADMGAESQTWVLCRSSKLPFVGRKTEQVRS